MIVAIINVLNLMSRHIIFIYFMTDFVFFKRKFLRLDVLALSVNDILVWNIRCIYSNTLFRCKVPTNKINFPCLTLLIACVTCI